MRWTTLFALCTSVGLAVVLVRVVSSTPRCAYGTPAQDAVDVGNFFPSMMQAVHFVYAWAEAKDQTVIRPQDDLSAAVAFAWWHFHLCTAERGLDRCRVVASEDSPAAQQPGAYVIPYETPGRSYALDFIPEDDPYHEWAQVDLRIADDMSTSRFHVSLNWEICGGQISGAAVRNAFIEETD
jgi:hypothetical protein